MWDVLALGLLFVGILAACWFIDWMQQPGGRRTFWAAWSQVCAWRRRYHHLKGFIWDMRFAQAQERSLPSYPPEPHTPEI